MYALHNGDCLELMRYFESGSVDMVLADPPYGTTACKWDSVIPFEPMWAGIKHVAKRNAAIVMTASQPFTSALVMSQPRMFKHIWTWIKDKPVGHLVAKKRPMQASEDVVVMCDGSPKYNPIMVPLDKPYWGGVETKRSELCGGKQGENERKLYTHKHPTTLLRFQGVPHGKNDHPTQKPVALMEYLIRTYTNEGDTVLDFTMGSGTTGVACANTGRNFIGIELDAGYFEIARRRVAEAYALQPNDQDQRRDSVR